MNDFFTSSSSSSSDEDPISEPPPLQIDWLFPVPLLTNYVAISSLPGCRFRTIWRNVDADIGEIVRSSVSDVFVLVTRSELLRYRVPHLLDRYKEKGLTVHHWPFADGTAPPLDELLHIIQEIQVLLQTGSRVLIHCYGGLGRACLVAACLVLKMESALEPEEVVAKLRSVRGPGAVQTVKQYNFIMDFRTLMEEYLSQNTKRLSR